MDNSGGRLVRCVEVRHETVQPAVARGMLFSAGAFFFGALFMVLTFAGGGGVVAFLVGLLLFLFSFYEAWRVGVILYGVEEISIDDTELVSRRQWGRFSVSERIPTRAAEGFRVASHGPRPAWQDVGGLYLEVDVFRKKPIELAAGMGHTTESLEWLARHLERGVELVRDG